MTAGGVPQSIGPKSKRRMLLVAAGSAAVVALMALDTTVVAIGSDEDLRQQAFNPDRFGESEFPRIRDQVSKRAPDAPVLAAALEADKAAAIADFGTMSGAFPVMTVRFTGTAGEAKSGIFAIDVEGVPDGTGLRVQTGPAINGTELRDITGDIDFGAFTNQIEYQNAGAGINRAMAASVLSDLDRETLTGKTISVVGACTLINPKNWLVTPVALEVEE